MKIAKGIAKLLHNLVETSRKAITPLNTTPIPWIQVEVSARCSFSCIYCPQSIYKGIWKEQLMSLHTFKKLVPLFPFTNLVYLQGWGEPLQNPLFFDFVKIVKQQGAIVGFTTNGMLIDEYMAQKIILEGIDIISFSLAGTSPEINDTIRKGTSLMHLLKVIKTLKRLRNEAGLSRPRIHLSYMFLRSHASELERLPTMALQAGVDKIVINTLSLAATPDLRKQTFYQSPDEDPVIFIDKYIKQDASYKDIDIETETKLLSPTKMKCPENPGEALFVGSDGTISPCVFLNLPLTTYPDGLSRWIYGSLEKESISTIRRKGVFNPILACHSCIRLGTFYTPIS